MSSATPVTPITYAQASISPVFTHTASLLANKASLVAGDRLRSPSSSRPMLLVGGEAYDFPGKLSEAYQLLQSEEYEEARALFQKIRREHLRGDVEEHFFISAHSNIGIAYSYPDDASSTSPRADAASAAIEALTVFDNRYKGNTWDSEERSSAYLELRSCYKLVLPLIPKLETKLIGEIQTKIANCSRFILPMDNFNELVREADRCAAKMQPTKARQLYEEARSLKLRGSPFATIACVICLLNYASTFNSRNQKKDELLAEAQSRLSQLYDDKEIVYSQLQWTKEKFFATLVDLLTKLHALMPGEHEDRQLIQKRIGFCKAALPEQVESELELSPLRRRKVSRDFPGRSRSPAMIFAGFLVLGLAAVGVIALYRRFIVRAS